MGTKRQACHWPGAFCFRRVPARFTCGEAALDCGGLTPLSWRPLEDKQESSMAQGGSHNRGRVDLELEKSGIVVGMGWASFVWKFHFDILRSLFCGLEFIATPVG
jgi:hypothetical protein